MTRCFFEYPRRCMTKQLPPPSPLPPIAPEALCAPIPLYPCAAPILCHIPGEEPCGNTRPGPRLDCPKLARSRAAWSRETPWGGHWSRAWRLCRSWAAERWARGPKGEWIW